MVIRFIELRLRSLKFELMSFYKVSIWGKRFDKIPFSPDCNFSLWILFSSEGWNESGYILILTDKFQHYGWNWLKTHDFPHFKIQTKNKFISSYKRLENLSIDEMRFRYFQSLLLSTTMCSDHCRLWWHPFEMFWLIKLSGDFPHKLSSEGKSKSQSVCESWSLPTATGLFWTWTGWSEIFWFLSSVDINPDFSNIFGFKVSKST